MPPALPRPPTGTWAFTATGPSSRQALSASSGVWATRPAGISIPRLARTSLAWYSSSFTMLDHHKSAVALAVQPGATVDLGRSGTGLLYDHVGRPPELAEFAALVEDHDLWRHSDPRSAQLAALLGLVGHERFISRFASDPRVHFTEGELLLMEVEARRRQDYIERRVAQAEQVVIGGRRWAVCFAEQYQSDLADALMKGLGVEATAIVNAARATVSLRARDLDVSLIARRFGGGGHARAAAFTAAGKPLEEGLLDFKRTLVEA